MFGAPENVQANAKLAAAPAPEPIAMTAPVLIDNERTMMFLLPASKYGSIHDAPTPSDPRVRLQTLPARLQAVRTFSGNLRPARAREQLARLLADLRSDGVGVKQVAGAVEWQAAGYNAPFVLPWFKTNEVLVSVDEPLPPKQT